MVLQTKALKVAAKAGNFSTKLQRLKGWFLRQHSRRSILAYEIRTADGWQPGELFTFSLERCDSLTESRDLRSLPYDYESCDDNSQNRARGENRGFRHSLSIREMENVRNGKEHRQDTTRRNWDILTKVCRTKRRIWVASGSHLNFPT